MVLYLEWVIVWDFIYMYLYNFLGFHESDRPDHGLLGCNNISLIGGHQRFAEAC
jgi:hypothetical protein